MLLCSVKSPFYEKSRMGYRISLSPDDEGIVIAEIDIYLFTDVESNMLSGLDVLLGTINECLSFGSYRLWDETGTVMFSQGIVMNDLVRTDVSVRMIGKTLELMERTVCGTGRLILRYLGGESLDDIVEEIGRVGE